MKNIRSELRKTSKIVRIDPVVRLRNAIRSKQELTTKWNYLESVSSNPSNQIGERALEIFQEIRTVLNLRSVLISSRDL